MLPIVRDATVWNSVRTLYAGAAALFVINILLGIWNVFTEGTLPAGQRLAHFHAGSIGWVTLGVIATMVWVFTGPAEVSDRYRSVVKGLTWTGIIGVGVYVVMFYGAFNDLLPKMLLPIAGIVAAGVIWVAFGMAWRGLGRQPVVTPVHVLLFSALLIASLGAAMGVLRGINVGFNVVPYPSGEGVEPVGAHAAPMDMYLLLAFAAMVELLLRRDAGERWGWAVVLQAALAVIGALAAIVALYGGIGGLVPLGLVGFVLSALIYLVRIGWRTFATNPFGMGRAPAIFFGGAFLVVYVGMFVYLVAAYFSQGNLPPHALLVSFQHITMVGMATNLLMATVSAFAAKDALLAVVEPIGYWTITVGLLAFVAGEMMAGTRHGALIMAIGVLVALYVLVKRLMGEPGLVHD